MDQNTILIIGTFSISISSTLLIIYLGTKQAKKKKSGIVKTNQPVIVDEKEQTIFEISDLHLLKKISEENIESLNEEKIYRIEELRKKIITKQDTDLYSKKLGIYKSLVEDWVRLGEFSTLHGITQEYIDLLEMNGIKSTLDLYDKDPEILYKQLMQSDSINQSPTLGMLKHWIRTSKDAKERESRQILIVRAFLSFWFLQPFF